MNDGKLKIKKNSNFQFSIFRLPTFIRIDSNLFRVFSVKVKDLLLSSENLEKFSG